MTKKIIAIAIVSLFIFSVMGAYAASDTSKSTYVPPTEKTKDRLSSGMDNLLYGPTEIADNLDQTKSKGTKVEGNWNARTKTGVERGIARVCTGIWKIATFWYSESGCVTSSAQAKSATK